MGFEVSLRLEFVPLPSPFIILFSYTSLWREGKGAFPYGELLLMEVAKCLATFFGITRLRADCSSFEPMVQ